MKVRRASEMTDTEGTSVPPILTDIGAALNPPKFTPLQTFVFALWSGMTLGTLKISKGGCK